MTVELGLRARKKLVAMRRIQEVALDLFDEHGYDAVTVERVAQAAEVSPSSVYRYFGTKERIVLHDEFDPAFIAALDTALGDDSFVDGLRRVLVGVVTELIGPEEERSIRRRMHYVATQPVVRAGMMREAEEMEELLRGVVATHTGVDAESLEVRVTVHALVAAFLTAVLYWTERPGLAFADVVERTFTLIAEGFSLPVPSTS